MATGSNKPQTIDEYIRQFPADIQDILERVRSIIRSEAPQAVEAIKYGIPTFVLSKNLVHFGAFQNHLGFYPTPSGIEEFQEALSHYQGGKGSVQFPYDQPLPDDLIRRIVRYKVEEFRRQKGG